MWIRVFICFLFFIICNQQLILVRHVNTCLWSFGIISKKKNCGLPFYSVKGVQRTECLTLFGGTAYITGI